jgi:formamidopyrimidine-DNA glycosylase
MPELPEVEVTAQALDAALRGRSIQGVEVFQPKLRWPVPRTLSRSLTGQTLDRVWRRGKYLLWTFNTGTLIAHMGMSGSWRVLPGRSPPARAVHDHIEFRFEGSTARFHDPRRFGALLWHPNAMGDVCAHPLLIKLGQEPFDPRFDAEVLFRETRGVRRSIKALLLAGDVVVGVGNIYASESLFAARIHPETLAGELSLAACERLVAAIRRILSEAIALGGASLRDFTQIDGVDGNFTDVASVYGREGSPCTRCGTRIRRMVQGQRATYFCPKCQQRVRRKLRPAGM